MSGGTSAAGAADPRRNAIESVRPVELRRIRASTCCGTSYSRYAIAPPSSSNVGTRDAREIKLRGNLTPILQMAASLRALAFGGGATRLTAGFADGQNATRPSRRSCEGLKAGDLDCRCRWLRGRATR